MAELYTLTCGPSKQKQKRIMTDLKHKCENYRDAIKASAPSGESKYRWFDLRPATEDETIWKRNQSNEWTGYDSPQPKILKKKK